MDARQLRYFVTVARLGSFSAAARRLHIAQPALSRHVRALEELLGVPLLERTARGVRPTAEGAELLEHGSRVLDSLDGLPRRIGRASAEIGGRVVIGLPTSASAVLAVPLLTAALRRFPAIRIHLIESLSGYLKEWIESGRLDLAVIYDPLPAAGIRFDPILVEDLCLVGPPGSLPPPAAGAPRTLPLAALPAYPLLLPGATHSHRRLVEGVALAHGVRLNLLAEVDSLSVQKAMVQAGAAFTILPPGPILADLAAGRLQAARIVDPSVGRAITLASSVARADNQACNALARLTLEVAGRLIADGIWPARLDGGRDRTVAPGDGDGPAVAANAEHRFLG